jgi:AraC-like DNA-binding protein
MPYARPRHDDPDGQPRQRLWLDAGDIAPLLHAAAHNREERGAFSRELSLCTEQSTGLVALADYFRLTRTQAIMSREESFGLAPRPLVNGTTDFVIAQAALGKTLAEAMHNMARAYNRLHVGEYNFVEASPRACVFRVDDTSFPYTRPADASVVLMLECVLIYLHSALSAITGQDLTPAIRRVSTRRAERTRHDPLSFWSCPVECGAHWYAIEYAPEVARTAVACLRLSEASIHNRILSFIEHRETALEPVFTPLVRQAIRDGARGQEDAARRIGISVATMRRKLVAEGHTFRRLRQDYLNEAAKLRLLQAERVADVADMLGFSDPRSFARAFKEWNGQTPRAFRRGGKPPQ